MKPFVAKPLFSAAGTVFLPGDKSIAHRAIIISALCQDETIIKNFPANQDCLATIRALRALGIKIHQKKTTLSVFGQGLDGLKKPKKAIFTGDSGTTFRLLLGVLAGQDFQAHLNAGKSLSQRPMRRVTEPLRKMGASMSSKLKAQSSKEEYPPINIKGGQLRGITYRLPIASAQVKSAILLAGLNANGKTTVIEPLPTRDHTERILKLFHAGIKVKANKIVIEGGRALVSPGSITVPGDISSAAFFLALGVILPKAKIILKNVGLNPRRIGIIKVLKRMGAIIKLIAHSSKLKGGEPVGDIQVNSGRLRATKVRREEVPFLIDELPILMVAACFAEGKTLFEGVGELRVKETDRIKSMCDNLVKMGARIRVFQAQRADNIEITGTGRLCGAEVKSQGDHRTAMSMVVAGLASSGQTRIDDISCINKSFPEFLQVLNSLIH